MKREIKLISDFNFDLFYNFLKKKINIKNYELIKPNYELFLNNCYNTIKSNKKSHFILIWSRIEGIIKEFDSLINYNDISYRKLDEEVNNYINVLKELSKKTNNLIVISWTLPYLARGQYLKDLSDDSGVSKNLNKINLQISEKLKKISNIFFLNIEFILQKNCHPYNQKLWYTSKIPFNNQVFELAADEFVGIINSFEGKSKKLLILDLDNTLWGGEVGELGWENINLGGHNFTGEAFVDFQKKIKSLKNKGIQLAIISKNEEDTALNVFKKNKEMILNIKDFATWRINWEDKAKNLIEITKELNISNDSVVFIDDNIAERERIKSTLPEVLVPNWPEDPSFYAEELLKLNCFYANHITKEDKLRTRFYQDEKKRTQTKNKFLSHNNWLKSLHIKVFFENVTNKNKKRVLQLINKTNQMNLSTRRLSEKEFEKLINSKNTKIETCRVLDKFGDMGLVGLFIIKFENKNIKVLDFILSCRAFGRSIEKLMVYKIIKSSKKKNINEVIFKYLKTGKNKPCYTFLKSLNLNKKTNDIFVYNNKIKFQKPEHLQLL